MNISRYSIHKTSHTLEGHHTPSLATISSSSSTSASLSIHTSSTSSKTSHTLSSKIHSGTSSINGPINNRGPQLEPIPKRHLCTSQNTASRLVDHHHLGAGACESAFQRPTEAQLRWAQFQSECRAQRTSRYIKKLMQTPMHVEDVPGAINEDWDSSSCSSVEIADEGEKKAGPIHESKRRERISSKKSKSFQELCRAFDQNAAPNKLKRQTVSQKKKEGKRKHKNKNHKYPQISKGRRALLRVSQRAFEKRKQQQLQNQGISSSNFDNDDDMSISTFRSNDQYSISSQSRRRILRGTNRPSVLVSDDEEVERRLQRFEDAYVAMATVYEQSNINDEDDDCENDNCSQKDAKSCHSLTTVKRWTRPQHLLTNNNVVPPDGREATRIPSKNIVHRNSFVFSQKAMPSPYNYSNFLPDTSQGQTKNHTAEKCQNLLDTLQEKTDRNKLTPRKRLTKFFNGHPVNDVNHKNVRDVKTTQQSSQKLSPILDAGSNKPININDQIKAYTNWQTRQKKNSVSYERDIEAIKNESKNSISYEASSKKANECDEVAENDDSFFSRSSSSLRALRSINAPSPSSFLTLSSEFLKTLSMQYAQKRVIDTDLQSDVMGGQPKMSTLLLSPTIITKRYRQATHAIKNRQWNDITYLLNANPWLAEMRDLISSELLLHTLSLYGTNAPDDLTNLLFSLFEDGAHKIDNAGNLPMHLAAISGNMVMLTVLGSKFKEGASVLNNMGMLPLHLAILYQHVEATRFLLGFFPSGVSVADGEGNLPLHLAAIAEDENAGLEIISILLEKDIGVKTRFEEKVDGEIVNVKEVFIPSGLVKNNAGETPVLAGVKMVCGWGMLQALLEGEGGHEAVENFDESGNNVFHQVVGGEYANPSCALAILKYIPSIVSVPNKNGVLPIELACMNNMPREVLLGMLIVDLPVDIDNKEDPQIIPGRGSSWWFIVCECNDSYPNLVKEVLTLCNHHQRRELCFMRGGSSRKSGSILRKATPKSKLELRRALRFVGRYEFMGSEAVISSRSRGLQVFDALDFEYNEEGTHVYLHCFSKKKYYAKEILILKKTKLDSDFIEKFHFFEAHEVGGFSGTNAPVQFCIAIEKPDLTLSRIVEDMSREHEHGQNMVKLNLYLEKVSHALHDIAIALSHLHEAGVIHGDVGPHTCGLCGDKWKLLNIPNAKCIGETFKISKMGEYTPPEAIEFVKGDGDKLVAKFKSSLLAEFSVDIWSFGKLCYEVFVGEVMINFDPTIHTNEDVNGLHDLGHWNNRNLKNSVDSILSSGVDPVGADLARQCLCVNRRDRPKNMKEILSHPFWNTINKAKVI